MKEKIILIDNLMQWAKMNDALFYDFYFQSGIITGWLEAGDEDKSNDFWAIEGKFGQQQLIILH